MISRTSIEGSFPIRPLGEIVDFLDNLRRPVTESERRLGPYPYYGANGQQGWIDAYLFDEPLLLIAEDGGHFDNPARGVAYKIEGKTWVNNHAHVVRPRDGLHLEYLHRVLENYDLSPFVTGTTRGKLTKAGAASIPIPLPSSSEQKRIAKILDAADALRAKRRYALAKLDTLAQSTFMEMFGDPARNPKAWQLRRLGDLAVKFSDGPFGSNLKSDHYVENGVRVIRLQNIGVDEFDDTDRAYISESHFVSLKKHECLPGDVLVGTLGDPNLRACIQPSWLKVALNKADCVQVRVDDKLATNHFLTALLNCPSTESLAQSEIHGQTRSRISMGRLRELVVPVPPVGLQVAFSNHKARIDKQRLIALRAQKQVDALFTSLQHRAFRGEL